MNGRDASIDILRGIAIFTMIAANMAAHSLVEPHSFLFRLYGSIAAPLFVLLAGMMVSYTAQLKTYSLVYYIKRSLATLLVACLIDVFLWKVLPLSTFDVLYVIAFAMPIIYGFIRLNKWLQLFIIICILSATPFLQNKFGYTEYPFELQLFTSNGLSDIAAVPFLKQFFIDGWFPIFPWLGVSLLGAFLGNYRISADARDFEKRIFFLGCILVVVGSISWIYFNPTLLTRQGYSELFYPPTLYYLFSILGIIFILFAFVYKVRSNKLMLLFSIYGRSSLLVYILHTTFIVFIFNSLDSYSTPVFIGLYLLHATVLWVICFIVQKIKKDKKLPFAISFILGS